jgi:hypothetical protein
MKALRLNENAAAAFEPFLKIVLNNYKEKLHSIHVTGSALTEDFKPDISDVNSVFVLNKMDLKFLEDFAHLGKKFGRKHVASPLIMTPEYILSSLDVFPVEFLTIKIIHKTVFGDDIFSDIEIKGTDLRRQCERELKVKLIGIRQGYLSSSGDKKFLSDLFTGSLSGYMALFRGIIVLFDKPAPYANEDVLSVLEEVSGVNLNVFKKISRAKKDKTKLSIEVLNSIFEDYYYAIERLGDITDEIKV